MFSLPHSREFITLSAPLKGKEMNEKLTDLQVTMVNNLWQYLLTDFWHAFLLIITLLTFFLMWRNKKSFIEVWFNGYVDELIKYFTNRHKINAQSEIKTLELESQARRDSDKFDRQVVNK